MCLDREVLSLPELKKKHINNNESTQKTDVSSGFEYERVVRCEEEGFYSTCGQAFIRIQRN
ncbi:hypothetical protein SAMN04488589_0457 [Methanolobus vulcani]|jgi:hypothetical protein|uniref:Uncharacterized protein n=1 Tax=Methanolobus vulcani TaxID=38026 RepID=A0A7Z7FBN9_9EURY|nr:hypothetical protein SAMN04488589_0457 [Methanolobus vulcani]